jgi:hypothetical protein
MKKLITNIVFTKNRPLQLHGYLESLYKYFPPEMFQTYILYKVDRFHEQYLQLFKTFSQCEVVEEDDFYTDFLNILEKSSTDYILFGVDDVVFFDSVDFDIIDKVFNSCGDDIFGFSLRFSREFVEKGSDKINELNIDNQKIYSVDWTSGRTPTTRYPFELGATVYKTDFVKNIICNVQNQNHLVKKMFTPNSVFMKLMVVSKLKRKTLKKFGYFYSPNKLESWPCRWCQQNFEMLPKKLFFQRICASAIQVNMVNITTKNGSDNSIELSVEKLNEKYKKNYRMDMYAYSKNKPSETHSGREFFFIREN